MPKNSIPKQQLDTQAALVRQYDGVVKSDQGAIDAAKLDLVYCRITPPVSGRVGLRLVEPGNIVHASDTNGLIVITQVQPITVVFPARRTTCRSCRRGSEGRKAGGGRLRPRDDARDFLRVYADRR